MKSEKLKLKMLILILFLLNIVSCKEKPPVVPPQPPETKVTLMEENKSCTEIWVRLTLENFTLPVYVELKKDGSPEIQISNFTSNDTLLYIDSLWPGKTYNINAIVTNTEQIDTSAWLQAVTLDTTTHNFNYQTFELGDPSTGNSSILWDVDIIDENNIWAVGEIYVNDSLGMARRYNAAHWDGNNWDLERIPYYYQGQSFYNPIQSILTFDINDIWFCGNGVIHWDGNQYNPISIPISIWGPYQMNKIWGTSSDNLYIIGNNGNIAYYNGSGWRSIESGTELDLTDSYGNSNEEVYSSGVNIAESEGILLKGNSDQFNVMINSEIITENELFSKLYGILESVWIDENNTLYTGGNLLFQYKNSEWDYVRSLPENYIGGNPGTYYRGFIYSIRGNGSNDYIIAGDRNTLKHFNGLSWEQLGLPYDPQSPIIWRSVRMKNNTAVAVGDKGSKAFIILLNK